MMNPDTYQFDRAWLDQELIKVKKQAGERPLLPLFCEQTRKILAKSNKNYLRYGPYWWAMKAVLKAQGLDVGQEDEPIWREQFTIKDNDGTVNGELTLLAGWLFGDENMEKYGVLSNEYEIDGHTMLLFDPDQDARMV
jgi:hypothetical protein